MTGAVPIVRLKMVLKNVTPKVERWLVVPQKIRLDRLHAVIQAAMGWTDSHLWEFRTKDCEWGIPYDEDPLLGPALDARKATLRNILEETGAKTIHYVYDFGDNWEHAIKLDRFGSLDPMIAGPFLVHATGACPPEDCGGPWRYMELLEALKDPNHDDYGEAVENLPENFDPAVAPQMLLSQRVEELVKAWAPKPRKKGALR
jgi:hypothetical protein